MRRLLVLGVTLSLLALLAPAASAGGNGNSFVASLKGQSEATPVDTNAQGTALFKVKEGDLTFKLIVANIDDVFAAHIHCAPEGLNGPVGVTLFGGETVSVNGILSQGPITAPNAGNACGWEDVDDILDALASGDTYVNVHTLGNPPGEIRGQIK